MKFLYHLVLFFLTLSLISCQTTVKTQDLSKTTKLINSKWEGTYKGILPCEQCIGIEVLLILRKDQTYYHEIKYIKNERTNKDETKLARNGKFSWDNNSNQLINLDDGYTFYVGKGFIKLHHISGKTIDKKSRYQLKKIDNLKY